MTTKKQTQNLLDVLITLNFNVNAVEFMHDQFVFYQLQGAFFDWN